MHSTVNYYYIDVQGLLTEAVSLRMTELKCKERESEIPKARHQPAGLQI